MWLRARSSEFMVCMLIESTVVNRPMVVKRFKTPLGKDVREVHKRERYWAQMEVQSVSQQMANEFNNRYAFEVCLILDFYFCFHLSLFIFHLSCTFSRIIIPNN